MKSSSIRLTIAAMVLLLMVIVPFQIDKLTHSLDYSLGSLVIFYLVAVCYLGWAFTRGPKWK